MDRVTSKDGTSIGFERRGSGPAVILVGGAMVDHSENAALAAELAAGFTVYNYDRRGRGESTDTLPYALEREIEDIEALAAEAGDPALVYGMSSGGALALEAAAAGVPTGKVAVYDVPYSIADEAAQRWRTYVEDLQTALDDGRRGDAVGLFLRQVGVPDQAVEGMRRSPAWDGMQARAHTLAYDAACLRDGRPPAHLAGVTAPTLVVTGGGGPAAGLFDQAAAAIGEVVPHTQRRTLDDQTHQVDPKVMAAVLTQFHAE